MSTEVIVSEKSSRTAISKDVAGSTAKKEYVLNDIEALKKKLDNCKRSPPLSITNEAVNGSCVTVAFRTSLFEFFKSSFTKEISTDERITRVDPVRRVVADTNHHGEANVEYQLEVEFCVSGIEHKVKILCFETTCTVLVQNMGGKPKEMSHLGNQYTSMYFTREFIMNIGQKAFKDFPDMDEEFIPLLQEELKKMQEIYFRNKKKSIKPLPKVVKCCSLKCRSTGNLDIKNIDKYAQCDICKGYEHFNCANIKDEGKHKYINGLEKFVCSSCFVNNHKSVTNKSMEGSRNENSIGTSGSGEKETERFDVDFCTLEETVSPKAITFECDNSGKKSSTESNQATHNQTAHESYMFKCEKCDFTSTTVETLQNHIEVHINFTCEACSFSTADSEELASHINQEHAKMIFICGICEATSANKNEYKDHIQQNHGDYVTVKKDYLDAMEAENKQLKEEANKLKEDLERLHSIFDTTKNSNRKDNQDIDVELAAVREQFRVAKEENVYLKEKNDTLFKLGRMALDKEKSKEPLLEIVEQEDEDGLML